MFKLPNSILQSKNEKVLAIIGKEHLDDILNKTDNNKTTVILTDKRIYQFGTVYIMNGRFMSGNIEDKIIELNNVSNISIIKNPSINYNIIGLIFIVIASIIRFIPSSDAAASSIMSVILSLTGLVFVVLYLVKYRHQEFIKISGTGTDILLKRDKYTSEEISYFVESWKKAKAEIEKSQNLNTENIEDIYVQLEKLNDLKVKGIITEDEFDKKKSEILNL